MESVSRLYNLMRSDFFNIPIQMTSDVRKIYRKIRRTSNFCCIFFTAWNAGIVILYFFFPGVPVDYILHHTGSMAAVKTGRKKILGGWYPVPMTEDPYFEIVYAYEFTCVFWVAALLALYLTWFFQMLMCLYAHFVVLGFRLSKLKVDHYESDSRKKKIHQELCHTRMYAELREIILEHQKIIKYTDELRSIYNPMVTVTIGVDIIVLIIGAIQILLGNTNDPSFIFQVVQVFSFVFMEASLFCVGSSLISTASSDLQFSVYCSDWYKTDVKFRKLAQMLMVRSRKSSTLTAIVMYPVNLGTLEAIVRFTYSATALMMGMVKNTP